MGWLIGKSHGKSMDIYLETKSHVLIDHSMEMGTKYKYFHNARELPPQIRYSETTKTG